MPNTNTIASATVDDNATMFTPVADPALPDPDPLPPAAVPFPLAAFAAPTSVYDTPGLLLQSSPLRAVAFALNTISAQLYNALPSSPTVTTCRLPWDPSVTGRSAGTASLGMHSVPLPVSFQKGLVSV